MPPAEKPEPRKFGSTEHLASEAIAAYVDGELRMNAYMRAAQHIGICADCAHEVEAQQQARGALRRAAEVAMPSSLLGALSRIPTGEFPLCGSDYPAGEHSKRWSLRWRK
ncbi:RNA polymerase subunit sigma-70 [Antrihabitans sp. YC2-6]|uniref:RNA polymerase subunit sigma-70 n=1 Tax=Antrihabitans sp. YC2-6 TaxID=2799498 RepID=UPI0018F6C384|nr:RNA polymerase subunit sigma-70 [Antrihabitans sp. YC2-6]MBJ8343613.1 RNA polymerase subunit sigma-70 [Antrihabitans sp. YC2-6]